MRNTPFLTREEERELIAAWQDRKCYRSRDRLVEAHILFAYKAAKKYCRYSGNLDDLRQEAVLGLMRAADKFDLSQPVRFATYAQGWVRSFMQTYTVKHDQLISMGTTNANKAAFFRGERLDIVSIDRRIFPSGGDTVGDCIEADNPDPNEIIDAGIHHDALMDAVEDESLSDRQRDVVKRRTLTEDVTLNMIAVEWGVSRERVRQIEEQAKETIGKIVRKRLGVTA